MTLFERKVYLWNTHLNLKSENRVIVSTNMPHYIFFNISVSGNK